jgi:hypothetical protein
VASFLDGMENADAQFDIGVEIHEGHNGSRATFPNSTSIVQVRIQREKPIFFALMRLSCARIPNRSAIHSLQMVRPKLSNAVSIELHLPSSV